MNDKWKKLHSIADELGIEEALKRLTTPPATKRPDYFKCPDCGAHHISFFGNKMGRCRSISLRKWSRFLHRIFRKSNVKEEVARDET